MKNRLDAKPYDGADRLAVHDSLVSGYHTKALLVLSKANLLVI